MVGNSLHKSGCGSVIEIKPSSRRGRRHRESWRPIVEHLEDRLVLAVIAWDGGPTATGTNWNDPVNWAGNVLPGTADDAEIGSDFAGINATSSANVTIRSVTSAAPIEVTAGTFTLGAATSRINAAFIVSSGTLRLAGTTLNGTGTLANSASMDVVNAALNVPLNNQGTLLAHGTSVLNGPFSTATTSLLRVDGNGSTGHASLTVAQGFSNQAAVELTGSGGFSSQLTVTSGILTNAAGGAIRVLASGASGGRTLTAQLDNRGTVELQVALTLSKPSAAHSNSGTITLPGGNLTLSQTGTAPSFTNTGTIVIGSGRTFSISGGTLNYGGGALSGPGTMPLSGVAVNLGGDLNNANVGAVSLVSGTVSGPGALINAAGKTLTLTGSTVSAPLLNQGTLLTRSTNSFNGSFSAAPGSVLRVDGNGFTGHATLTAAQAFTNEGKIELTGSGGFGSQLTVTSGSLTNATGATIQVLSNGGSGSRVLAAQLDNQGTLQLQTALTLTKASADHSNSGTITLVGGNLTLTQSGTTPSFTNSGTIDISSGHTFSISGGTFNFNGGVLTGPGALPLTGVIVNLGADLSNATIGSVTLYACTVNGPGALSNAAGKTLTLTGSTLNATLRHYGSLLVQGTSAFNGPFTTAPASVLRVDGNGFTGHATLTVAQGFTNEGKIELTGSGGFGSQLTVTSGSLTNTTGATIQVLSSGGSGSRVLAAQLENQGALQLQTALTLTKASADHSNSGTITLVGGNLTLTQSGTTPSFTNTGSIEIGSGRTFSISGGTINFNGGALTGPGALSLSSVTVYLGADLSNATLGTVSLHGCTVNGPEALSNAAGKTLTLTGSSTLNAPLLNYGTLLTQGTSAFNGPFTTAPGSILRVDGNGFTGHATLTVAQGFTNEGKIELTGSGGFGSQLTVSSGKLTNAAGASIQVSASGTSGSRVLAAQLDNQGTLNLATALTINKPSADHTNSGTITLMGGNLTVSQSGTTPTFTNTGAIDVAAGRTFTISAGGLTNNGSGILTGDPTSTFAISGNLVGQTSSADRFAPQGTVRLTGPGSAANPQLLEVLGQDRGSGADGFINNFLMGTLSLSSTYVRLVDNADNSAGSVAEALYVNRLIVPTGTTLDLNLFHVYARQVQINGTVLGGTVTLAADGGPIAMNAPTPGTIAVAGEVDEWTFFGRAGRAVTIVANPGTSGSPPALSPTLNRADVRLIDTDGAVLATASSTTSGQLVTLLGVELPLDGTYRIQVQAAAGADRGNYVIASWNATVDTRPVLLNQQTNGSIENPFSVDRWTFTARANQQVMFDWVNATPASISFRLFGPNGFTGFTGLSSDSGLVTLPADGAYVLEAVAGTGPGGNYAFRLVETTQTDLTLGTVYTSTLIGSGQAQLFRVNVPASQQLRVALDDASASNRNEIYAKFGAPPTRADIQESSTAVAADQDLFVPNAAPGTWYILLYSAAVPAPGPFTLTATAADIFLTGVTPERHSGGTNMVLTLTGAGFDHTTVAEVVDSAGNTFPAGTVSIDLPTQMTATFLAGIVPPGTYSVRLRRSGGGSAVLPGGFEVLAGGQPHLETNLVLPSVVGRHGLATIYVEYANTGSAALPAPLLTLRGSDRALLTLDDHRLIQGFWTSALPDGFTEPDVSGISTIQILGSGATPGVLQPGERVRVPVYYAGLLQPWDFSDSSVQFSLDTLGPENATPIDWPSLQAALRPPGISGEAWEAIYANLTAQIGSTWGDYERTLAENAQYLGRLGQRVVDVSQLWSFEVEQAVGFSPLGSPADVTDIQVDAPGLPITFRRVFASSVIGRYEQGPFGRGWVWAHGWQHSLMTEPDGTVVILGMDGEQLRFEPNSRRPDSYFSPPGESTTLTALGGGAFLIRELDGMVTRIGSDGRVAYVEDPNGNRITATWAGTQLTRLTHSAGQFLQITYDAGRIASVTDQTGRTVRYTYDPSNEQLLSVQGIDGQTTHYDYSTGVDAAREHTLLSIEYPDDTHEFFTYDPRGRLESISLDNNAERVALGYDSAGRVTATDALGQATSYFFDHQGLLAAVEDALGRRTLFTYDSDFNLTRVIDPLGQNYLYRYDRRGNLVRSTDPLGQVTAFTYTSGFNRLASVIDARGNPMHYGYDSRGNLTSITYADGSMDRIVVDARGEIDTKTNRRGQLIDYHVNADGRLERRDLPGGGFAEYQFNARGNLEQAIDPTGITQLEYLDPLNPDLPTKITYPNGRFLQYTYQNGRRTEMVDPDGVVGNYLYDAAGRLEFLRDGAGNLIVQYRYDAAGQLEREDHGNGTFTEYQYDPAGQLEHLIHYQSAGVINTRFDYIYDDLGRRTRMTTPDGVWDYAYDGIGQLTRAAFTSNNAAAVPNQDLKYIYDAAGNRVRTVINSVTTDYTTNSLNQYTQVGTATYTYDLDGNLISRTGGGITTTYAYDAENRLIGVTLPDATWAYQYDVLDNLRATVHNGQRTDYLIDPFGLGNVVGEYSESGNLVARYTHGLDLTSRVDSSAAAAYYDFDGNGNTAELTGAGGTILNAYSYLPFGEPLAVAETVLNRFTFVGDSGVMSGDGDLYFMRQRWYDPALGRFTAPDSIGLSGGDANLYRYVINDPANLVDPNGLEPNRISKQQCETFGGTLVPSPLETIKATYCLVNTGMGCSGKASCEKKGGSFNSKTNQCLFEVEHDIWRSVRYRPVIDVWGFPKEPLKCVPSRHPPKRKSPTRHPRRMAPRRPPQPPPGPGPAGSSGTVGSADPNEKTGPAGFGPDHFIAAGLALPYRIDFENEASATAPAQRVVVTDQLDANLDWNTFGWTEVGFGDVLITIPPGSQHFQTTADMTFINRDFQVEIELDLNSQTGLLTAVFQSIDPATSLPPDVLTGFLPPEDGTGRGMGHISYTVEPRAGLATGAPIKNIGIISFDVNEPIATNQVNPHDPSQGADPNKESRSTLDAGTPISSVASLPGESEGAEVLVQWSGQDDADGSGVRGFDIYVSDDGGPFTLWLADTSLTEAVYTGQFDHGYAFYSIARDNVGHVEAPPAVPDAQTRTRQNLHVDARGPYTILEGEGVTLSAVIAGGDPSDVSWDVDADGVFDDATGPNPTLSWEQLQAIGVVDGPSSFAVRVRVNDSHGHEVTSAPTSLMVHNVPPAPDAGADQTVNEGEAVTLHGTFSDPGTADTHSFLWHVVASNGQVIADGSEPIFRFVPEDEGSYAVAFTVMDDDGGMNTSDMTVTVHNLPPTITAVTNDGPIRGGSSVTVTVAASDPAGAFDPLRYEFDCNGDGTYDIGPQAGDSASCTFASGGNYTVWVRVTDDDGGVNTGSTIVTVTAAVTGQILLLNGAACGALSMTGNASVVIPGTLQINSNCQAALSAGGNSKLSASRIDVVGGISASGNARINPAPSTGVSSAGDPFASLAPPSDSTQLGSVKCKRGAQTLSPGTYFQITASNKCDLSLEPGTYIVAGGGIELSGQAKLTGADVLLYNAGSNFPKPGGSFGAFTVSGQARIELIPPSSGPFAGLSVFQARDNTRPISLSGGAAATMGTIYAPGAKLMLTGTGKLTAPLVVDTLKVTGNAASQLTTRVQRSTDTVEQAAAEKHRFTGIPKSVHVRAIDAVLADHAVPDDPEHHVRGR